MKDERHPNDIRNSVTPEKLEEIRQRIANDPWRQQVKALREKIESGTATQEEKDEYNRLVPPLPEVVHHLDGPGVAT